MSETPIPVVFDRATLARLGWGAEAPGQLTTAHPHHDPVAGALVNYAAHFGPRSPAPTTDAANVERQRRRQRDARVAEHGPGEVDGRVPLLVGERPGAVGCKGQATVAQVRGKGLQGTVADEAADLQLPLHGLGDQDRQRLPARSAAVRRRRESDEYRGDSSRVGTITPSNAGRHRDDGLPGVEEVHRNRGWAAWGGLGVTCPDRPGSPPAPPVRGWTCRSRGAG